MSGRPLVLVVNGPNLGRLGTREPEVYGTTTLAQLCSDLRARAEGLGLDVDFFQSDVEDEIVKAVSAAPGDGVNAIMINPAALSHFSRPLRHTLAETGLPIVEVHISNIHAREPFRRLSLVSGVARGVICGLGVTGYALALDAIAGMLGAPHDGADPNNRSS